MTDALHGRTALITGASAGIGRAIAVELARQGVTVGINGRNQDRVGDVVTEIEIAGGRAVPIVGDISREWAPQKLVEEFVDAVGSVDILVNNAGEGCVQPSEEVDRESWNRVLDLMLNAPFFCAQAAGRHMLAAGRGVIINIASIAGQTGLPQRAAYCTAKHGLEGLTRTLGAEWASRGVRVLAVDRAYVATEFIKRTMATGSFDEATIRRRTPADRLGRPEEVASVVAFLCSDAAAYMTGSSVQVDGGWLAYGGF